MLAHDALRRGAHEGRLAGQHLVEHATQTVDVAPPIQLCAPHALLGAHVQGRSHRETGLRQFVASRRVDRAGDAKVRHDGVTRFEEDVLESRSEEHTSELQSLRHLVCRLLLEKKMKWTSYTGSL